MSIYDRVRGGKPINPAVALYNHWHTLLVGLPSCKRDSNGQLQARSQYGTAWYNVSFHHAYAASVYDTRSKPPISYGGMILNSNGTFTMGTYHGWKQRDALAKHTFLRWGHVHGEYVWCVDTSAEEGSYGPWNGHNFKDWNRPVPYVAEKVAGGQGYSAPGPWLKLSWNDANQRWFLDFHQGQKLAYEYQKPVTQEVWDWYAKLREKRYRRYEREHLIATGALKRRERKIITAEEVEERQEAALEVIIAHMNVTTAARTTPLRKATEEVGLWELPGCP